jgi:hypothetical protein
VECQYWTHWLPPGTNGKWLLSKLSARYAHVELLLEECGRYLFSQACRDNTGCKRAIYARITGGCEGEHRLYNLVAFLVRSVLAYTPPRETLVIDCATYGAAGDDLRPPADWIITLRDAATGLLGAGSDLLVLLYDTPLILWTHRRWASLYAKLPFDRLQVLILRLAYTDPTSAEVNVAALLQSCPALRVVEILLQLSQFRGDAPDAVVEMIALRRRNALDGDKQIVNWFMLAPHPDLDNVACRVEYDDGFVDKLLVPPSWKPRLLHDIPQRVRGVSMA